MFIQILASIIGITATFIVYCSYMLLIAFTLWMLVDAAKQDRFWWTVIVIAIPIIGPAAYYLTEKKHEYAKISSHHIHDTQTEEQHERTHPHHEHRRKGDNKEDEVKEVSSDDQDKQKEA